MGRAKRKIDMRPGAIAWRVAMKWSRDAAMSDVERSAIRHSDNFRRLVQRLGTAIRKERQAFEDADRGRLVAEGDRDYWRHRFERMREARALHEKRQADEVPRG